ncbi:MAG: HAMP domain-containing protein, partial [Polyangiaceae bacterium]|nr:HAMP domain-containing protein [Polyangiaceae bacterium]
MAPPSRTALRLTLAVLLAAVIPLIAAITIARSLVSRVSAQLYNPSVGQELDRSLELYRQLAGAVKSSMRFQAEAIASQEGLRAAAALRHVPSVEQELQEIFPRYENLVSLAVITEDDDLLTERNRQKPVDEQTELQLEVRRPLTEKQDGPMLLAVFVTPKATFDEQEQASENVRLYRQIEASRTQVEHAHLYAFAVLLAITMLAAATVGTLLSRKVTRRIDQLARATRAVGAGDLTVRVPAEGRDEITDLARAFNRMLDEVERSRVRIEFLQRMGTWQEMARRLAHEIKNPLTPIQLAVEEVHARYRGDDARFRDVLDTTLGVVREEVATLRRLVTEFSAFARLPRAELRKADLGAFLREQRQHVALFSDDECGVQRNDADTLQSTVGVSWDIPDEGVPVYVDRQMLHRVLVNLVRNAAQAVRDERKGQGHVLVSLRPIDSEWVALRVEDDGPGIAEHMRESIFEPYVTTKSDGTGLGLSIVKKI